MIFPSSSQPPVFRLVIAAESRLVLAGLRSALEDGNMVVEAAVRDRSAANDAVSSLQPDALLLSLHLPGGAAEAVDDVRRACPATEVIVFADEASDALMFRMVEAGAHGFLLGQTDPARLPNAVLGVLSGEAAFPRRFVRVMADELARRDRQRRAISKAGVRLTPRQAEILELISVGIASSAIAKRLNISEATVRSHAAAAGRKLTAGNETTDP